MIVVRIPNLDRILTGVNYGSFRLTHNPRVFATFHPRQTFVFSPTLHTELFSIDITLA